MQVVPYLNFNGDCKEAFTFYAECLGGTITTMMTHGETEMAQHLPAEWHSRIMHASMKIGDASLMASDGRPGETVKPHGIYVTLQVDTPEEAERIFNALAENGSVEMPIQKTFWSERFGMTTDRFGTPWMINCDMQQGA